MMLVSTQMKETTRSGIAVAPGLAEARARLSSARSVVALTGAGISAESGVPTFRGAQACGASSGPRTWPRRRPSRATRAWCGSGTRGGARSSRTCSPTPAITRWPASRSACPSSCWPRRTSTACTRGPAAAAWSSCTAASGGCAASGAARSARTARPLTDLPPRCACGALLRPGVVWFGEALPEEALHAAFAAARAADVVLVVGTSSLVYPAAAVPQVAVAAGAFVVEVNPERTPLSEACSVSLRGRAAEVAAAARRGRPVTETAAGVAAPATRLLTCPPTSGRASGWCAMAPAALSNRELLALLLGTGSRTRVRARRGGRPGPAGLRGLAARSVLELERERGLGRAKAARLLAALELGARLASGAAGRGARVPHARRRRALPPAALRRAAGGDVRAAGPRRAPSAQARGRGLGRAASPRAWCTRARCSRRR